MTPEYRILIFGGSCSGKTFLAKRLAAELNVRVLHLDDEFWFGAWQNIGSEAIAARACEEARNTRWIIEGNYSSVRAAIWQTCTHVIYMETPLWKAMLRAIKRSTDRSRSGVPAKIREASDTRESLWELLRMVWRNSRKRGRDLDFLASISGKHVQVIRIRSTKDQERLFSSGGIAHADSVGK
ncbi:MAG: hypothetical protein FWD53_12600 [Phycisphaerales bacterium]|nr:hypothetical protein [Phycisphaerales bacterium]